MLPGISGGVLAVVFGVYKPAMEFLSNPFARFKTHVPLLIPYGIGGVVGFLGIANLLAFFLEKYPDPSVCLFIGLITGMLPSLFREAGEKGRRRRLLDLHGGMHGVYFRAAGSACLAERYDHPEFRLVICSAGSAWR